MTLKTNFAAKPTLTGEFAELRPVEVTDAVWMLAADPETIRLTGTHSSAEFFTLESLENWYATRAEHDDRLDLSIIERATGEWAGEVVLNELEVYDFNPRARHVYEKAGFVHEGTKRDALQWDGEWVDYHCMALLRTAASRQGDTAGLASTRGPGPRRHQRHPD